MLQLILTIISAMFSPEMGRLIEQIQKERRRALTRDLEAAQEKAQSQGDTRDLQKELGKLSE